MAENYISAFYSWVTGNTITAARLNGNITNLIDGLSAGVKTVNIGKLMIGSVEVINSTREATLTKLTVDSLVMDGTTITGATSISSTDFVGAVTGNASTATALATARTIGGVSFDGTANITVATATGGFTVSGGNLALGANSITMSGSIGVTGTRVTKGWFTDLEVTNAIAGSITGNAATATKLATARAINGVNFDGTAAITVTSDANTLSGTTLKSTVVTSSLTTVGATLIIGNWKLRPDTNTLIFEYSTDGFATSIIAQAIVAE